MSISITERTSESYKDLKEPLGSPAIPVPDGSAIPKYANILCRMNPNVCKVATDRVINGNQWGELKNDPSLPLEEGYFKSTSWDPLDLDVGWIFTSMPLLDTSDNLNLDIVKPATAGYVIKIFEVDFGANTWPKAVAVAVPKDLQQNDPISYLIYFQNTPQPGTRPYYRYSDPPYGWDWLYFQFWRWFNNLTVPIRDNWKSFGLTYQLTQSKKKFILVIPDIPLDPRGIPPNDPRKFCFLSGSAIKKALLKIQAQILPNKKDEQFTNVALGSFSSGCNILTRLLTWNLNDRTDPLNARFVVDDLHEVYIFDPPEGNSLIISLLQWQATQRGAQNRVIRFYSRNYYSYYTRLLPTAGKGLKSGSAFFGESTNKNTTLVYLPFSESGNDIWMRACMKYFGSSCTRTWTWEDVHHTIPALFLTDAASRSTFT